MTAPGPPSIAPFYPRFGTPYEDRVDDPRTLQWYWKQLHYVFLLPDPAAFPKFPHVSPAASRTLNRYLQTCDALSVSTLMHYPSSQSFRYDGASGEVDIRTELPPTDAVAGASVLLRQLASHDELGSFTKVRKLIGQLAHSTHDAPQPDRLALSKAWHEAHRELRNHPLKAMTERKIFAEIGQRSIDEVAWEDVVGGTEKPDDLLRLFNYGDVIHWGDHAEALESLDPLLRAHKKWLYLDSFWALSNFYLGYAGLVRAAVGIPA